MTASGVIGEGERKWTADEGSKLYPDDVETGACPLSPGSPSVGDILLTSNATSGL